MMIAIFPRGTGLEPDAGLSLIETLVLLAIVGMTLVLGATSWVHWREARRLSDYADKLTLLVNEARIQARASGSVISVMFDPQRRLFQTSDSRRSVALSEDVDVQAGVAQLGAGSAIAMLPDGSSTGGDISLALAGQRGIKLTVSWINGEVRRADR
ncbi:Tfp pilus assembly protein FimT/FimU [Labrys sp. KB_33_2]|uniref:pilus assembly FimT family protein n=1 Tax=Labrys sp. KB_33_2 TaxID=3237479 RepID=UPI003F933FBD